MCDMTHSKRLIITAERGVGVDAQADGLAPLVSQFRHAKRCVRAGENSKKVQAREVGSGVCASKRECVCMRVCARVFVVYVYVLVSKCV